MMISERADRRGLARRVGVVFLVLVCATTCLASLLGLLWRNSVSVFYVDQPRVHFCEVRPIKIESDSWLNHWQVLGVVSECAASLRRSHC